MGLNFILRGLRAEKRTRKTREPTRWKVACKLNTETAIFIFTLIGPGRMTRIIRKWTKIDAKFAKFSNHAKIYDRIIKNKIGPKMLETIPNASWYNQIISKWKQEICSRTQFWGRPKGDWQITTLSFWLKSVCRLTYAKGAFSLLDLHARNHDSAKCRCVDLGSRSFFGSSFKPHMVRLRPVGVNGAETKYTLSSDLGLDTEQIALSRLTLK